MNTIWELMTTICSTSKKKRRKYRLTTCWVSFSSRLIEKRRARKSHFFLLKIDRKIPVSNPKFRSRMRLSRTLRACLKKIKSKKRSSNLKSDD